MNELQAQTQNTEYEAAATAILSSDAQQLTSLSSLGPMLIGEFNQAENDRRTTELRWLQDLRQYRGQYDPEVIAAIGANRSKAFIRKTRVKVKTVNARCMDLLFPANAARNWSLDSTPVPSLTPEQNYDIKKTLAQALKRLPTRDEFDDAVKQLAKNASKQMTKVIDDQLADVGYKKIAKKVLHSGNLFGTGILKAPLVERKIRQRFVQEAGKWVLKTETYTVPFIDFVPLWRFFPDMSSTELEDCRYVYERHLMTKAALLKMAEKKSFSTERIRTHVIANPKGQIQSRYYDSELMNIGDRVTNMQDNGQYEVLERWGWLDAESLIAEGMVIPQNRRHETFFTNIWLLPNGIVIKMVLQPINGVTWPYHLYYFDKDETSIFAEGLGAVMRDDQTMINAGARMILDNAAITAGPQLEVNMRLMARNEKADEMYPFKIWPRTGEDANSPAVRVLEMPSKITELQGIVGMFENNADEVTAIPRYMYGENATAGAAGTATGMSMLMGAASIVMKDLISSYDEVTEGFIRGLYRWNMQFNPDQSIKGDFDAVATGASSMMAKEVRAQQLDQFAAVCANTLDAPYIKRDKLLRQRAEAHELNDVVKTEEEVRKDADNPQTQMQAQMQQLQMQNMQLLVANLEAKLAKVQADTENTASDSLNKKMEAAYAAMEAAGIAVANPNVATAGDSLLRSAGWADAAVQTGQSQPGQPVGAIPPSGSPHEGQRAGIETPSLTDGIPNGRP